MQKAKQVSNNRKVDKSHTEADIVLTKTEKENGVGRTECKYSKSQYVHKCADRPLCVLYVCVLVVHVCVNPPCSALASRV